MSLYLKYRPQGFSSLVGQDHIKTTLQNSMKLGRFSHAYLFCGSRGTGKTSSARILAKALNCTNINLETLEPCQKCEICTAINEGSLIDVIEIDAASNRGIDEIRELRETIKFAPTQAANKIYIIDEVHMLTKEAFNALLKTLEEPPANVYFILATTEVHKIPDTIISRCQRFDFKRFSTETIVARLEYIASAEKVDFEPEALVMIAKAANGGMRDAISLFEQLMTNGKITLENTKNLLGSVSHDILKEFIEALISQKMQKALDILDEVHQKASDLSQFKKDLVQEMRTYLLQAIKEQNLEKQKHIAWILENFQNLEQNFKGCVIPQLSLEVLIAKQASFGEAPLQIKSSKKPTTAKSEPIKTEVKEVPKPETPKVTPKPIPKETAEKVESQDLKATAPKKVEAELKVNPPKENLVESSPPQEQAAQAPSNSSDLEAKWSEIISKIPKTAIKILLQQTKLIDSADGNLRVGVSSSFYLEKLNKVENKQLIEGVVAEVMQCSMKVDFSKVSQDQIPKPAPPKEVKVEAQPIKEETKELAADPEAEKKSIVDEALAMFAEEIQHE